MTVLSIKHRAITISELPPEKLPSVSLILPVRNEAPFIEKNLRTLLKQDYPADKLEILVADGMSDDGTGEIVEGISQEDPRVRLIKNPERIVPTAMNAAIEASTGEIIIRVDGHVVVAEDFVRESVQVLQEKPDAWAVGGPIVNEAKTKCGQAIAIAMAHPLGVGNATHRRPGFEGYGEGTAFPAMYRWVFDKVGNYDEELVRNQDDEFYFRIGVAGGKFFISPRIRYVYYVREKLSQLFRQYYQYSVWRIPVMLKHRQPTTLRQMVPSLFYLAMVIALVVGIFSRSWLIALGLPAIYITSLLAVGISTLLTNGPTVSFYLPFAISTMHAGYAWGMIQGWICHLLGINIWSPQNKHLSRLSR